MKNGWRLAFFILSIFIVAGQSRAQTQPCAIDQAIGAVIQPPETPVQVPNGSHSFFQTLDAAPFQLSYDTTSLPTFEWLGHGLYNPYVIIDLGERFTLPSSTGFVDSLSIELDSITQDSVAVDLIPDTLYQTSQGLFHLMNVFGLPNPAELSSIAFGAATVHASDVHFGSSIMVHFPHVAVPQSFFVAVIPNLDLATQTITNAFYWRGDEESQRTRTTDNVRSAWIGVDVQTNQALSAILDGTFISTSGTPLYTNLYATLYGTSGSSGVAVKSNPNSSSLFPNPASNRLNIPEDLNASSLELLDALGRPTLTKNIDAERSVDVSQLAAGSYEAIVHTANGIVSEPVVINR